MCQNVRSFNTRWINNVWVIIKGRELRGHQFLETGSVTTVLDRQIKYCQDSDRKTCSKIKTKGEVKFDFDL